MTTEILGKTIEQLVFAPAVQEDTFLAIQRVGSPRVEKVRLNKLIELTLNNGSFTQKVNTLVNNRVTQNINDHLANRDPHGDRGYTDNVLSSHRSENDPHGDRNYSNIQLKAHTDNADAHNITARLNQSIQQHSHSSDPHGDREYARLLFVDHISGVDPHGDRDYTDNKIGEHIREEDPHGDRLHTKMLIDMHQNESDPHGIKALIKKTITEHEQNSGAHSLDSKFKQLLADVDTKINNNIQQKIGTTLPQLVDGKVAEEFLVNEVVISSFADFPYSGDVNKIYVDTTYKRLMIYRNGQYEEISSGSNQNNGDSYSTTDYIEPGINKDRQYLTQVLKQNYDNKFGTIYAPVEGISTIETTNINGVIRSKAIVAEGSLKISEEAGIITFKDSDYLFEGSLNSDIELTTNSTILQDVGLDDIITGHGHIYTMDVKPAGETRLVNSLDKWDVEFVFGTRGESKPLRQPTNIVISSNGLVITGKSDPTTVIEVYDSSNNLLGTGVTLSDGSFTVVLGNPQLSGNILKLYNTQESLRSSAAYLYTKNIEEIREPEGITFKKDGTGMMFITSRQCTVKITDINSKVLAEGVADDFGNVILPFNTPVINGDTLRITLTLNGNLTLTQETIVKFSDILGVYALEYNTERTILKGKAEPNSIISFYDQSYDRITRTAVDVDGNFTCFTFSKAVTSTNVTIEVKQDERLAVTTLTLDALPEKVTEDPLVKEDVTSFAQGFIKNTVNRVISSNDDIELLIEFDPVLKDIKIKGINKKGLNLKWIGTLTIDRSSIIGE